MSQQETKPMTTDTLDYAKTIKLPKTTFPARAGLPQKEPQLLQRWEEMDLYKRQRALSKGRKKFVLHMGPPFANNHIHMGTALSTLLKDIIVRTHQMAGYDAPLVPGFDCHGLPIETEIEKTYRAKGKSKDDITVPEFRAECRAFAGHWVGVQTGEFKRLGILADWENPYLTMLNESEALIAEEIHKFLLNGSLYRGAKPVMWSVAEGTALAEAEIEYKDHTSDTAFVLFPVKDSKIDALKGAYVAIWTTTPWTLPGNRAIAYGADMDYRVIEVTGVDENAKIATGTRMAVNKDLADAVIKAAGITAHTVVWEGKGADLAGTTAHHVLHEDGYGFDVRLLAGDFVTTDVGTGFVHIAPGHGEDDYRLGLKEGVEIPETVLGDGTYAASVPLFAGVAVYQKDGKKGPANKFVTEAIAARGRLLATDRIQHSYPHSWRSKTPVIFRTTPQWFISMEKNDLRKKAMAEIEKTRFVPERGRNRIGSMVEGRGDWCVSRQRTWGVPIAIFVDKKTGEPLCDKNVLSRTIDIFKQEGGDAWHARNPQDFLGNEYDVADFEKINDIIDVWFESGCTQSFSLAQREELHWPADLYLEGSDQHRGWFQSSLLVGTGTRGHAPYKSVLTHGFVMDAKGYKMSKSGGNAVSPIDMSEKYGADILRLWVVNADYVDDIRFGTNVIDGLSDIYRRIRNTFSYLLGNLSGFDAKTQAVALEDMSEFDRFILHRLSEIDVVVREAIADFDLQRLITTLHAFCNQDLSAFYFDVNKDNLYCNAESSVERRATLTVLDHVFNHLVHWLSPILAFTCEEAWLSYKGLDFSDRETSIHLSTMPDVPASWHTPALTEIFAKIYDVRRVVTGALERKREEKIIGKSLEANVTVYVADAAMADLLARVNFADICIVSAARIVTGAAAEGAYALDDVAGVSVTVTRADAGKCERCWKQVPDVGVNTAHATLCSRCASVVG